MTEQVDLAILNAGMNHAVLAREFFTQVYLKQSKQLQELAAEYHKRCENYDRTVCTGPIGRGGVIPMNYREAGLVNRNARLVLLNIVARAESEGISRREMHRAISRYKD